MSISIHSANIVPEGDGVSVKRLMPVAGIMDYDPFVLWDHFDIAGGGFPPHPHRGFEAITWMFSGGMRHRDNLGNESAVYAGGAQRFTAGRGITHSEMPDGHAVGIQLWINLPQRLKRMDAGYQQADTEHLPVDEADGVRLQHIVGVKGVIQLHTDVEYLQADMQASSTMQRSISAGWRGFVYVVEGGVEMAGIPADAGQAMFVEQETVLEMKAEHGARLMWCFGAPHHEPIHQHGPFVD